MIKQQFTTACLKFFGKKPDQSLTEFAAELKQLTDQDRDDLRAMFKDIGIEITN